jgi:diguanylate cyclase (GGDEF)-like protein/PAS domain S-box-containing protein
MAVDRPSSLDAGLDWAGLFSAAPEALFVLRGRLVIGANRRLVDLVGVDPTGTEIVDRIPGWRDGSSDGAPYEATLRCADGSELPIEVRSVRAADATVASVRDARLLIAGREAQVALTEAEARYRSLVEEIPAVVYADEGGEETTYVSPQIERILGVTPQEYKADPGMWMRMVHPDDRERVRRESDAFIAGVGGDLADYRMVRPDGRVVWIRDRAYAVRDEHGRVLWEHGILFDVTELKEAEERVAHMAYHDGLTSLANRQLFEEALTLAVGRAGRNGTGVAMLFLDLDNFKLVNDSLGHHAGDQLLIELAERLRTCTRETDMVARQGGDEFLLLLADLDLDEVDAAAKRVATRVHGALSEPFVLHGTEFHARGSIGISTYPRDAQDAETLLKNADIAMYRAKRLNPGGFELFTSDADDATKKLSFATRLRQAVAEQNWVMHYQPVVDLSDRRVVGAEALIRWKDAAGGIVAPGEFIPVAEELGLIEAIGDWVLDEIAQQQSAWREAGIELDLSFNLSPRQLWSPRLAERVIERLRAAHVDPATVTAEITESTAMADPDRTQRILRELGSFGLGLAIDDFGTGYSSLARLKHMPVDVLKIDREFVRRVDQDVRLAGMVRAMIQVAQSLDMMPLAEGVETEGEYRFLRSNGCRLAQGFWFAHPVPAEELPDLMEFPGGLGTPATHHH